MVGSGVGAKNGILFKTGEALETLGKADSVALDKTGTITKGEPHVTDIIPAGGVSKAELYEKACAIERGSEHPLAKAVVRAAEERGFSMASASAFRALAGSGVEAELSGKKLHAGSGRFIRTLTSVDARFAELEKDLSSKGKTPLFFAADDRLLGVIAVADTMKEDSAEAIRELRGMGIHVVMLTGDNRRTAEAIGREAGVDEVVAGVLADDCAALMTQFFRERR
jgi:Cu2+-exporting ATPase